MKTLFIYNPNAGHMQIKYNLYDVLNTLSKEYKDLVVYASEKTKDIVNYVKKNGSKYELIIVSGGDGSLSEAVNGIMSLKKKPKLGYIPAGSTNDYASSLKLSKDMKKCTKQIVEHKDIKKIDIGKFNEDYFVYVAAFGAFTEVAYSTPQDIKNAIGHLAYLLNGINSISKIKSYDLSIKSDNETYDGKYIYGMITNTLSVGGMYHLNNRNVKLDDGLFEVMLIEKPKDLIELQEITAALLNSKIKTKRVKIFKTKGLTIIPKSNMSWTLDGEYGGSPKKVSINNIPKTITLLK
ncbi:MAG: YegS/Rv2252/BmrU family lipid kinase [Erysipelotrichaceae bacterium]|nr:YegS/Rv2252/BmrU family lipid kinase [Erysipelotrichaceae bacterium]